MNLYRRLYYTISIISILLLTYSLNITCTSNPVFREEISAGDSYKISGQVRLSDNTTPDEVFVWIEGLNIFTTTDEQGKFELLLHKPDEPNNEFLTGSFKIYYYLGNYAFDTSRVAISKGAFIFDQNDIDENGQIREIITLKKLLDISVTIVEGIGLEPKPELDPIPGSYLRARVDLTSAVDFVVIKTWMEKPGQILSYYIHNLSTSVISNPVWRGFDTRVIFNSYDHRISLLSDAFFIDEVGEYEFLPYLEVLQTGLPTALIEAIKQSSSLWWTDYIQIPFKLQGTRFSVVNRKLEGKVTLNDGARADNVLVWFEPFDLSVRTDRSGEFYMELPPRSEQADGGLNGEFDLYCFVGNYALSKTPVTLINGGTPVGSYLENITLQKLLNISTVIADSILLFGDSLHVDMNINPISSPLITELFLTNTNYLSALFFRKIGQPDSNAYIYNEDLSLYPALQTITVPTTYSIDLEIPNELTVGNYYVTPYIYVIQDEIPEALLRHLGSFSRQLHTDYLEIPFKRRDGRLILQM